MYNGYLGSKGLTVFPHIRLADIIFTFNFYSKVTVHKIFYRMQVSFEGGPYMRNTVNLITQPPKKYLILFLSLLFFS